MKRADLIRHLEQHSCMFHREGSNHTLYRRTGTVLTSVVPRHREIVKVIAKKICKQLDIPDPPR